MGGNQNTTIPDLKIEPTTIVQTKDKKNNQYVNNNVNKINNNVKQQTSDNNFKHNAIDNKQPTLNTIDQLANDNYEDHINTINKPTLTFRIHVYAIFNKTLINYLYDTGAYTSIIQKKIFNEIIKRVVSTQVVVRFYPNAILNMFFCKFYFFSHPCFIQHTLIFTVITFIAF
jgi:hypothetical protein